MDGSPHVDLKLTFNLFINALSMISSNIFYSITVFIIFEFQVHWNTKRLLK